MTKRRSALAVLAAILLLALAVMVLARLNAVNMALDAEQIEVLVKGESQAVLTFDEIQALPSVDLQKEIVSGSGDTQGGLFTAVPLRDLLDAAAPGWEREAKSVTCRASDNYTSGFTQGEVLAADNILVAYLLDGEPLPGKSAGGKGPFRLVIRDDAFGNRSTYWLSRIEVE